MPEPTAPVAEPSMEEYAASRIAPPENKATEEKPAATTPTEKVTTDSESAPGTSETEEEKKQKTGGGWQRRIDKLTKRGSELEETLNEERLARQRLEAKLAGRDPADSSKKAESAGARPEPTMHDTNPDGTPKYEDFMAFQKAQRAWDRETLEEGLRTKILGEVEAKNKQSKAQTEQERQAMEISQSFAKRSEASATKHPDFKEVVESPDSPALKIPAGSVMDAVILESEHGTEILYKLCQEPENLERILNLDPMKQARAMFILEQSFATASNETQSPEPKKAALPAPIRPVGSGTSKSTVKLDELPMDEYVRRRTAKSG